MPHSAIDPGLVLRAKTAFAICVAGEIFKQAALRETAEMNALNKKIDAGKVTADEVEKHLKTEMDKKALRVKIAADALDKTKPDARIFERYHSKPAGQTDAEFLLANLNSVELLDPAKWPPRKVEPADWKEHRHVMRGLEAYLQKAHTAKALSRAEQADVTEALRFIAPQVSKLEDAAIRQLLSLSR